MDAVSFEKTPAESRIFEINLATDQTFQLDPPDPATPVEVGDWEGEDLVGLVVPQPIIGGPGNLVLRFQPSGGVLGTTYYLRFMVTTVNARQPAEVDVILYCRQPKPN